ncbi:MAG: hypothetical protein WC915_06280 [archaeon]|jgi:hypothetical protein
MNNKTKTYILQNEDELVKDLSCEELCVISNRKEQDINVMQKKKDLIEDELYDKTCPVCK